MDPELDFTSLSDDEIMNLGPDAIAKMEAADAEARQRQELEANESEEEKAARLEAEEAARAQAEADADDQGNEADDDEPDEPELDAEGNPVVPEPTEPVQAPAKDTKPPKETQTPDPVASAKPDDAARLFEPFKANGRNMTIRNADEGIRLMQLGAGYNSRMEELKPKLAIIRTLEREGLLDSDKLGFLIDLHKKNPEAIGKLVKDSGVDVLDIDEAKVAAYKSGNYSTSEKEVELDHVLDGLKHSKTYSNLMDVVGKWDSASKSEVGNNPGVLNLINQHMEAGYYDQIVDELNRQKALGSIPSGTPFLAAYAKIGDELNAAGKFGTPETPPANKLVTPGKETARGKRDEEEARRKAAAPTRKVGSPAPKKPVADVWNMSDADFAKLQPPR